MIGSKVAYFLVGWREGWGPWRSFKGVPLLIYFRQLGPPPNILPSPKRVPSYQLGTKTMQWSGVCTSV